MAIVLVLAVIGLLACQDGSCAGEKSIELWVQATDGSGNFVADLRSADLEAYADGRKVQFSCFQAPADIQKGEAASTRETLVIYLDLFNMTPAEYEIVKPALVGFVHNIDRNKWDVFLAELNSDGRLGIVGPSQETSTLLDLNQRASANQARDRDQTAERRELLQAVNTAGASTVPPDEINPPNGIPGSADEKDIGLHNAYSLVAGYARREKERSRFTIRSLETLSESIQKKAPAGHKSLIYISGGFNLEPGNFYYRLIENTDVPRAIPESNADLRNEVDRVAGKLSRYGIAVHALSTRNLVPTDVSYISETSLPKKNNKLNEVKDYQDSLLYLAAETGGTVFENSNDFRLGFDKIKFDKDHHYLVCLEPARPNGKYHPIKLVVKRDGVTVRSAKGYAE